MQLKQQLEPYMRIAVQLPDDAAQRLRQLASEGPNGPLRGLDIRAIQLDKDSIISVNVNDQERRIIQSGTNTLTRHGNDGIEQSNTRCNSNYIKASSQSQNSNNFMSTSSLIKTTSNIAYVQLPQPQIQHQVNVSQHSQRSNIPTNVVGTPAGEGVLSLQQQQLLQQRRNMMLGGPSTSNAAMKSQSGAFNNMLISSELRQTVFKSPNTVCPMEGKIPMPPTIQSNSSNVREFPFESMRQARVLQGRDNALNSAAGTSSSLLPVGKSQIAALPRVNQQHLVNVLGPPPNVALKVIKNPQSGEIMAATINSPTNKTHFLQPPPPPYPDVINSAATLNESVAKSMHNYSSPAITSTNNSNNIAMSSPLLVNLLQTDSSSSNSNASVNQLKTLSSPQHQQQQQLVLQQSPLTSIMSTQQPQQQQHQAINSPMRTPSAPSNDFLISQQTQQRQHILSNVNTPDNVLNVPSSPTPNVLRTMQQHTQQTQQQQIILSANNNSLYAQQQQRFQSQLQQSSPQSRNLLRQQHQQRFLQQETQFSAQQQQQTQDVMSGNSIITPQQQQIRQLRENAISNNSLHQQHSPVHMHRVVGLAPQQQQFISANIGSISPATPQSPASSHHSIHSPHMTPISHQQKVLSPSTTPVQSPHNQQIPQAQLLPIPSVSPALTHNANIQVSHIVPTSPPSLTVNRGSANSLPPPPDYNQAAASISKWSGSLNKPMDSATKSSFQEFTRYQMQYNLQQQQQNHEQKGRLHRQQQSFIREVNNSLSGALDTQHQNFVQERRAAPDIGNSELPGPEQSNSVANTLDDLPDPLLNFSDLEALKTHDLDALLPTLSCDIDSTLSLDDKNELESLLQDAKDLNLDMIEENLSAVGMDINETALSLLDSGTEIPSNVMLNEEVHMSGTESQKQQLQAAMISEHIFQNQYQKSQHGQSSADHLQKQLQQSQIQVNQNIVPQIEQTSIIDMHQPQKQWHQQNEQLLNIQQNCVNGTASLPNNIIKCSINSVTTPTTNACIGSSSDGMSTGIIHSKQYLINPLTGELEPTISDDSDTETEQETQQKFGNGITALQNQKQPKHSSSAYNQTTNNIYDTMLGYYSDDSNSNSCNIGLVKSDITSQSPIMHHSITGSITQLPLTSILEVSDKTKDVPTSSNNKSQKDKKLTKSISTMCNKLNESTLKGSPRVVFPSKISNDNTIAGVNVSTGNNKRSKTNLLREKLQQGLREKKNKDATITATTLVKAKRERSKSSNKYKSNVESTPIINETKTKIATTTNCQQVATNSAIKSPSTNTLNTIPNINTPANITQLSCAMSDATSNDKNLISNCGMSAEKIKLRLKLGKADSVSPPYKIDTNFATETELNKKQQVHLNTQIASNNGLQQPMLSNNKCLLLEGHINTQDVLHQQHKKQLNNFTATRTSTVAMSSTSVTTTINDEPRVPPLHISIKGGKNSIVIRNTRKERKKAVNSNHPFELKLLENHNQDGSKRRIPLKRNHALTEQINNYLEENVFDNKQVKTFNGNVSQATHINGTSPSFDGKPSSTLSTSCASPALLTGKNGLTISSVNTLESMKNQHTLTDSINTNNTTIVVPSSACNNIGSATIGTIISNSQSSQSNHNQLSQLNKITTLPNSITLSTITTNVGSGSTMISSSSSGDNLNTSRMYNNLHLKHNIKTTATITPLSGKPMAKIQKPPSYLTAVQQLQLQKQQQLNALSEKQTQQQMIAAAVTMLPSATTLKRVEITKVDRKEFKDSKMTEQVHRRLNETNATTITSSNSLTITNNITQISSIDKSSKCKKPEEYVCDKVEKTEKSTKIISHDESLTDSVSNTINRVNRNNVVTMVTCTGATITTTTNLTTTTLQTSSNCTVNTIGKTSLQASNNSSTNGNGGGEDSGIESMDALSEKSPHQTASCSPQSSIQPQLPLERKYVSLTPKTAQLRRELKDAHVPLIMRENLSTSSTCENLNPNELSVADDEIEKALAKMEGFVDEEVCRKEEPMVTLVLNKNENSKINGEYNMLLSEQLDIKQEFYNVSVEDDDNDDLIKNLTSSILEETQEKTVNQNSREIQETTSEIKNSKNIIDDTSNNVAQSQQNRKTEITDSNSLSLLIQVDDNIAAKQPNSNALHPNNYNNKIIEKKIDQNFEVSSEIKKEIVKKTQTGFFKEKEQNIKTLKLELNVKNADNIELAPTSIEIPHNVDANLARVRTRASSRLNSPLDGVTKSCPSLDITTSNNSNSNIQQTTLKNIITTKSTLFNDVSFSSKTDNNTNTSATTSTSLSFINTNSKRKRPESDAVSTVNDVEAKRSRIDNTIPADATVVDNSTSNNYNNWKTQINETSEYCYIKLEESSDSDEPLIEIAGKARNFKTVSPEGSAKNATHPSHIINPEEVKNNEKISRNSRLVQQQQHPNKIVQNYNTALIETSIITSSANQSNSTSPPPIYAANSNENSMLHPGSGCTTTTVTTHNGTTGGSTNTNRGITVTTTTSTSVTNFNNNNSICINGSSEMEKISTRRSVRASTANKLPLTRSSIGANAAVYTNSNNINETNSNSRNGAGVLKSLGSATTSDTLAEARRKTRSTGIGDNILTESRRRRTSRDQK